MDVGLVRIASGVFTPTPPETRGSNTAIINNVFDSLVASLRAKSDCVCE